MEMLRPKNNFQKGGRLQTCGVKIVLDGDEMRYLVWPEVLVVLVVLVVVLVLVWWWWCLCEDCSG